MALIRSVAVFEFVQSGLAGCESYEGVCSLVPLAHFQALDEFLRDLAAADDVDLLCHTRSTFFQVADCFHCCRCLSTLR